MPSQSTTFVRSDRTAFNLDARPLIALDWSAKAVHTTADGKQVVVFPTVSEFLTSLDRPHKIVAEATIESWDADRRLAVIAGVRDAGHELYVFRPLRTARARTARSGTKSDSNDARLIYAMVTETAHHVYPYRDTTSEWKEHCADVNRSYHRARMSGDKVLLARRAEQALGPYRELTTEARLVLGNGRTYSPSLLAALMTAIDASANRHEFERLLGLHGSAHPTLLRSDVHHHVFRHARKRPGMTWQLFRRELRRARVRIILAGECA